MQTLITFALTLAAQTVDDGVYTHEKLAVRLTLPEKGWKLEKDDDKTLCRFSHGDDVVGSLVSEGDGDLTLEALAARAEATIKAIRGFSELKATKSETMGDSLLCRYDLTVSGRVYQQVVLAAKRGRAQFTISARYTSDRFQGRVSEIMDQFGFLTAQKNPWRGCGKGSWTSYALTSEGGTSSIPSFQPKDVTYTLVDLGADWYFVKNDRELRIPGDHNKVSVGLVVEPARLQRGEETLMVDGTKIKCAWTKRIVEGHAVQEWTSDEVPGGLVKRVSGFTAGRSTMELVKFEKKAE